MWVYRNNSMLEKYYANIIRLMKEQKDEICVPDWFKENV